MGIDEKLALKFAAYLAALLVVSVVCTYNMMLGAVLGCGAFAGLVAWSYDELYSPSKLKYKILDKIMRRRDE